MKRSPFPALLFIAFGFLLTLPASSQLAVRPEDPTGMSIREKRVRVIHADDATLPGTSLHLQQSDPWMAYQRGRSYYFREWQSKDLVFDKLPRPIRPQSAATNSCGICHNLPFPSLGAGGNTVTDVGVGLNTPHLFGLGLLETIGMQIRAQIMNRLDTNGNGYLDHPAETQGQRAIAEAAPGIELDFGSFDDLDESGWPDLNTILQPRMVDERGYRHAFSPDGSGPALLTDGGVVGVDFVVGVLGSSASDHMFPSLRMFASGVLANIMGILPEGEPMIADPAQGYILQTFGKISNSGARLTELFLAHDPFAQPDPAQRATISEGELDLFEWFQMNYPAPALGPQTEITRRGRQLLDEMACTSCHVADWVIHPADDAKGLPGDRRFFDLKVAHNPRTDRLEGRVRLLTETRDGPNGETLQIPKRDGFTVENVFTDLRHHDLGPRFRSYMYRDGQVYFSTTHFRTPPLWGIGSTAPYGHDGRSPTLDDVIRRHGGEGEASAKAYREATPQDRQAVIAFLRSLVLYIPETLPTDLDGDGKIVERFERAGVDLGPEVFRPELLFQTAPDYRGWIEQDGQRYFSYALNNVEQIYGLDLPALRDQNSDGVPDMLRTSTLNSSTAGSSTVGSSTLGSSAVGSSAASPAASSKAAVGSER